MHDAHLRRINFNHTPFTVVWEMTRACALNCVHCRAVAQPRRHPLELTTDEGFRLIDQVKAFGDPIFVLTGGDPLMRRDIYELIRYATQEKGLRTSMTPSATALVTRERLQQAKDAGILRVAISLDGPTAEIHDAFRGFSGSFRRTMEILDDLNRVDLSFQINTTVSRHNLSVLEEMPGFVERFGAVQWSVFFLVPMGRGKVDDVISPEDHERVFHWLYDLSRHVPFDIKSTAAPQYRRVAIERERQHRRNGAPPGNRQATGERSMVEVALTGAGFQYTDGLHRPVQGVNDGKGFVFVSHAGEVCPSGFLPLVAGNVRVTSLSEIYRHAPLFQELRNPDLLKGKCGICEYREVCGGARSRAYALTGDYLASEPYCVYEPGK
ncbi:MAG: TIGR04053 family radical SAM/SPASM domain-containing protein [Candidatus Latescibacteria bacterium]|nr:TIGR04053 family radical SAM/SPASM domain-containing protein [Candidatus Latescibacterota bacterium]